MASVTIHLQNQTERSLEERAKRGGQSLESYLEQLVERHIRVGVSVNNGGLETDEDELGERPGAVFSPRHDRDMCCSLTIPADGRFRFPGGGYPST